MRLTSTSRPGRRARVEAVAQRDDVLGDVTVGPSFTPTGFWMPREELDVRAVELAGALARPQEVRRAVVPVVGEAVAAGERLLVAEQQRLVRRVEVDLVELELGVEVDAARGHEAQRAVDLGGERVVALRPSGLASTYSRFHACTRDRSAKPPLANARSRFKRGRRLVVRAHEPGRIGPRAPRLEREVVHHVAAERRQLDAVALSRWAPSGAWRTGPRCGRSSPSARRCRR